MSTLDRYLIRQTIPPFLLALGIFTFMLAIQPVLDYARDLLAKGVSLPTLTWLLMLLLPQAMSLAIPMAFLTGVLMALGRMSGDRESVALVACGISPLRVLRPILLLGVIVGAADMYVLMKLTPQANDTWRGITFKLLVDYSSSDIRPRVFYERFPNRIIYVQDSQPGGRWAGVFLADTSDPDRPAVTLAREGSLIVDAAQRRVVLMLHGVSTYRPAGTDARAYGLSSGDDVRIEVSAAEVFGSGTILPGLRELSPTELRAKIAKQRAAKNSAHPEIIQLHQMFSFPVACLIFGVIGLALGLNTRQEGRLAGLTLGLAVILVYYALMGLAEAWTKGISRTGGDAELAAAWARWIPNIGLGLLGLLALWRQTRPNGLTLPVPAWFSRRTIRPVGAGTSGGDSPVVAVRLPTLSVPLPRLLDRYVGSRYLRVVVLAFFGLLTLYYIGTFVDLADKLFKGQATGTVFLNYMKHQTPLFVSFVIPIATLIGVLATIGGLTRTGELVVMRACGISLYRTALPFFLFAIIGAGILFVLEDRVLAESNRTARMLRDQIRDGGAGEPPRAINLTSHNWLIGGDDRIYHYTFFEQASRANGNRPTLRGLSAFEVTSDGLRLTEHLYAWRAGFDGTTWHLERGWIQRFDTDPALRAEFEEQTKVLARVEDFRRAQVDPSGMTFTEQWEYIKKLSAGGFNVSDQLVNLHRKVAFPFVTIVMTLLAIPFGVTVGRKGTLYGIGLAAILAGGYFLLMTLFMAVGAAGVLPAWLAAWGANIIFTAGALYLVFTVRT